MQQSAQFIITIHPSNTIEKGIIFRNMSSVFENKDHLNPNQNLHVDVDFETPDSTAREGEPPLDIANSQIVKASTNPTEKEFSPLRS